MPLFVVLVFRDVACSVALAQLPKFFHESSLIGCVLRLIGRVCGSLAPLALGRLTLLARPFPGALRYPFSSASSHLRRVGR